MVFCWVLTYQQSWIWMIDGNIHFLLIWIVCLTYLETRPISGANTWKAPALFELDQLQFLAPVAQLYPPKKANPTLYERKKNFPHNFDALWRADILTPSAVGTSLRKTTSQSRWKFGIVVAKFGLWSTVPCLSFSHQFCKWNNAYANACEHVN